MYLLQIEHPVTNFALWKKTFDADPLDRRGSGVRRYSIFKMVEDPNYILIELVFDEREMADVMYLKLQKLWNHAEGMIITAPKARLVETIESHTYER